MIKVERLAEYSDAVAEGLGRVLLSLSSRWDGRAIEKEWLKRIITSDFHDVIVAYDDGEVVGMAVMTLIMEPMRGNNAYLEDFVVSAECQGKGLGGKIWDEILAWGREKGAGRLEFTSSDKREGAIKFYTKKGAEIYDTNFFRLEL